MTYDPEGDKDIPVYARGATKAEGRTTGVSRVCNLGGCTGRKLSVKWPDGKTTFPCTKGMSWDETRKEWRIE